jgi:toxin ParE1/3/4
MAFELILQPRSEIELINAFDYYSEINESVLNKFTLEIDKSLEVLKRNPKFELRYKSYRAFPVNIFPYLFLFEVVENKVEVFSFFQYLSRSKQLSFIDYPDKL